MIGLIAARLPLTIEQELRRDWMMSEPLVIASHGSIRRRSFDGS
jgi:hypothetical protein